MPDGSSSHKGDSRRIQHAIDLLDQIDEFVSGYDGPAFLADNKTKNAVLMSLQALGEAVRIISPELRGTHPEYPWDRMIGFRHRISHDYFGISFEIVWEIVEHELPKLRAILVSMKQTLSDA